MRNLITTALTAALLAATAFDPALAQSNPSAQQLIDQLKPSGTLSETTRGIKPLPPGPGPAGTIAPQNDNSTGMAPAVAPVTPLAGEAEPTHPSANINIDFLSGSATLTPSATAALDQLGKALTSQQLAAFNFKIIGHTDTAGDPATNQSLSEQRAAAVKSYLETKFGVQDSRLQSEGVGESDLAVPTPANTPNARNRRVEIVNLGK